MSRFLIVYFGIYGLMHALFYVRVRVILPKMLRWIFVLFLILMILMPVATRMLEKKGYDLEARLAAALAYDWMGFVFLAFVGLVLMTLWDLLSWGIASLGAGNLPTLSGKAPVLMMIGMVIALCVYGTKEAKDFGIEHLVIETDKLREGSETVRIVQISDIHLGLLTEERDVRRITDIVKEAKPDMLVATGDIVDGDVRKLFPLTALFREISPRYGKYAVTGNHEYYSGIEDAVSFLKMSGFAVLRGDIRRTEPGITVVGVDDPTVLYPQSETGLLSSPKNRQFVLLLKHRPSVVPESLGLFDLQLSGHTHGGQIFPFGLLVAIQYPLTCGDHVLPKGSRIHVSRGTGVWGPRMRILAKPEITVIELKRSK